MGIIKEVFGICDGTAPLAEGDVDAVNNDLDPSACLSAESGMHVEEAQEDLELGRSG